MICYAEEEELTPIGNLALTLNALELHLPEYEEGRVSAETIRRDMQAVEASREIADAFAIDPSRKGYDGGEVNEYLKAAERALATKRN